MNGFWQEVPVNSLPVVPGHPQPDIHGVLWHCSERHFELNVPGVARCSVAEGQAVQVARACEAGEFDARCMVQGLPLAALVVQRGQIALHAAALATPRGALVIAGNSMSGKSVLAAALSQRYPILADGVTPLEPSGASILSVKPCMADVALWRDAAEHLGFDVSTLTPARAGLDRYYIPGLRTSAESQALRAIVLLSTHNGRDLLLQPLKGHRKLMVPLQFTFNLLLSQSLAMQQRTFELLSAVLARCGVARVFKAVRPDSGWSIDQLVERIEGDILQ